MNLEASFLSHTLNFKFPAGTSRGVLTEKKIWYLMLHHNGCTGIGEASPLVGLSIDDIPDFEIHIKEYCSQFNEASLTNIEESSAWIYQHIPAVLPSLIFAFEVAIHDLKYGGVKKIYENDFFSGEDAIPINGLIWMGNKDFMLQQIKEKLQLGFSCLKMKIGALDFETECSILEFIRNGFSASDLMLRVDANGAFLPHEAAEKLKRLERFQLHSIEQPVKHGQWELMKQLCAESPVPVALDEELIGVTEKADKEKIFEVLNPPFIILKPTLLGGLKACTEWIEMAEKYKKEWWITSALESNIGLNAVCQYTAEVAAKGHQGLGTGKLYRNNIDSPLEIEQGKIFYNSRKKWQHIF